MKQKLIETVEGVIRNNMTPKAAEKAIEAGLPEALADSALAVAEEMAKQVPDGIVELQGSIEKWTVQPGKGIAMQIGLLRTQENMFKLAMLGQIITMRGVQADIEAMGPPPHEMTDHPGQTDIEEFCKPNVESCMGCAFVDDVGPDAIDGFCGCQKSVLRGEKVGPNSHMCADGVPLNDPKLDAEDLFELLNDSQITAFMAGFNSGPNAESPYAEEPEKVLFEQGRDSDENQFFTDKNFPGPAVIQGWYCAKSRNPNTWNPYTETGAAATEECVERADDWQYGFTRFLTSEVKAEDHGDAEKDAA